MAVNQLIRSAIECPHPSPRYAYMAPLYKQAKAIAWDYMRQFAGPIEGARFHESELRVELPGDRRITLLGADNPDSLRGIYLDGVVLDEYALMNPSVWQAVIRPTLVDRQGFAVFLGTPLGRNHFHELYEKARERDDVLAMLYRASETGVVAADELAIARDEMGPDLYAQEFECSFDAAIQGAYYARQMEQVRAEGRIRTVPWQPALPVDTFWDLGISDSTAILMVQQAGTEVHVIDYLEDHGQELAHYARELDRRPYLWGEDVLPHDGGAKQLATGKTLAQQLRELGRKRVRVLGQADVEPGIEAARRLFARCWFDEGKTRRLVDALSQYRRAWNPATQSYADRPLHDWTSHGADAFRYLAMGLRSGDAGPRQSHARSAFDPMRRSGPGRDSYARAATRRVNAWGDGR
jgi:hypothetical protein